MTYPVFHQPAGFYSELRTNCYFPAYVQFLSANDFVNFLVAVCKRESKERKEVKAYRIARSKIYGLHVPRNMTRAILENVKGQFPNIKKITRNAWSFLHKDELEQIFYEGDCEIDRGSLLQITTIHTRQSLASEKLKANFPKLISTSIALGEVIGNAFAAGGVVLIESNANNLSRLLVSINVIGATILLALGGCYGNKSALKEIKTLGAVPMSILVSASVVPAVFGACIGSSAMSITRSVLKTTSFTKVSAIASASAVAVRTVLAALKEQHDVNFFKEMAVSLLSGCIGGGAFFSRENKGISSLGKVLGFGVATSFLNVSMNICGIFGCLASSRVTQSIGKCLLKKLNQ